MARNLSAMERHEAEISQTAQQLVEEARLIRRTIMDSAIRLADLYQKLGAHVRQNREEVLIPYMGVSTSGLRFASMLSHGVRKTDQTEKVLESVLTRNREEKDQAAQRQAATEERLNRKERAAAQINMEGSAEEAFDDLFGEDLV